MKKKPYTLNILLFIATLGTTLFAGSLQAGYNPIDNPISIIMGAPFSLTLIFILLTHELGHYLMSRRHGVDASLPYFIPAPTQIGTLGAIIKMRSPISNKRHLLDIGSAGPLAGMAVSVPAIILGLKLSEIQAVDSLEGIGLGSSILFSLLSWVSVGSVPENMDIILHPIAFAGWLGLFVTSLNLIPIGQLDGGHIAYSILGRRQFKFSTVAFYVLLGFGLFETLTNQFSIWLLWAVLIPIIGIRHPPTMDSNIPLDKKRMAVAWLCLLIFVLTFTPHPFTIVQVN